VTKKLIYELIIYVLVFLVGFLWIYDQKSNDNYPSDINSLDEGKYLRMVYIGSAGCSFSNNKNTHQIVKNLKRKLPKIAHANNLQFITTGVAVDKISQRGINYLQKSGPYDEVVSGTGWYNLGIKHYVWENIQGTASTPQVLLTITKYEKETTGSQIGNIKRKENLLKRYRGVDQIKRLNDLVNVHEKDELTTLFNFQ